MNRVVNDLTVSEKMDALAQRAVQQSLKCDETALRDALIDLAAVPVSFGYKDIRRSYLAAVTALQLKESLERETAATAQTPSAGEEAVNLVAGLINKEPEWVLEMVDEWRGEHDIIPDYQNWHPLTIHLAYRVATRALMQRGKPAGEGGERDQELSNEKVRQLSLEATAMSTGLSPAQVTEKILEGDVWPLSCAYDAAYIAIRRATSAEELSKAPGRSVEKAIERLEAGDIAWAGDQAVKLVAHHTGMGLEKVELGVQDGRQSLGQPPFLGHHLIGPSFLFVTYWIVRDALLKWALPPIEVESDKSVLKRATRLLAQATGIKTDLLQKRVSAGQREFFQKPQWSDLALYTAYNLAVKMAREQYRQSRGWGETQVPDEESVTPKRLDSEVRDRLAKSAVTEAFSISDKVFRHAFVEDKPEGQDYYIQVAFEAVHNALRKVSLAEKRIDQETAGNLAVEVLAENLDLDLLRLERMIEEGRAREPDDDKLRVWDSFSATGLVFYAYALVRKAIIKHGYAEVAKREAAAEPGWMWHKSAERPAYVHVVAMGGAMFSYEETADIGLWQIDNASQFKRISVEGEAAELGY